MSRDVEKDEVTFNALVSKGDIDVIFVKPKYIVSENGYVDKSDLIEKAKQNIASKDIKLNSKNNRLIFIDDINDTVLVNKKGLYHGLLKNITENNPKAMIYPYLGDILKNSKIVNILNTREKNLIK